AVEVHITAAPGGGVQGVVASGAAGVDVFEIVEAWAAAVDGDAGVGDDERTNAAGAEVIIAGAAVDDVLATVVGVVVTVEVVVAGAAVEDVVARLAEEGIVAAVAEELVVADLTVERVVATLPFEDVVAVVAGEVDVAAGPGGGVHRIVAGRAAG